MRWMLLSWILLAAACGDRNPTLEEPVKNQNSDQVLKNAKQKTKEEEKNLEEARRALIEATKKGASDIDKAKIDLASSLEKLRRSKIPLIQQEIEFLERYREKAREAFNGLLNQQSKSQILESYFIDQIK